VGAEKVEGTEKKGWEKGWAFEKAERNFQVRRLARKWDVGTTILRPHGRARSCWGKQNIVNEYWAFRGMFPGKSESSTFTPRGRSKVSLRK